MTNFAVEIRDAAIARLRPLGRYAPKGRPGTPALIFRSPALPTQSASVPCLCVFLGSQTMTADGEANHGEPSFLHEMQLNIWSVLTADGVDELDDRLAAAGQEILVTLLEDPGWLRLFEGVTSVTQQNRFEPSQYFGAVVATTITVAYRTTWPPRVTDNFGSVSLRTPDGRGADFSIPTI